MAGARPIPDKPVFTRDLSLGAHRGGRGLWPENTVVAFEEVTKRWPHVLVETDTRLTADGRVVLMHDPDVDRTTDGSGPIAKMTFEEVRKLDAGYDFSPPDEETHPYRGEGVQVPLLSEALAVMTGNAVLVELKDAAGIADAVVQEIRDANAEERVILASFYPEHMKRAQELAPELGTCFHYESGANLLQHVVNNTLDAYEAENDLLAIDLEMMDNFDIGPERMAAIREKGILIQVHTINDPERMNELLDWGADCVLTDRPDVLAEVLALRPGQA